ncbi:response regulator [Chlorogloeopsis fritschii]|uniref:response regulator n=1 Tax=Chlorogloeopsis fritschii TaxID=1124 RepID=UPI0023F3CEC4|nr:response regulator [Chlorogloeopsis fritschii]
MVLTVKKRILCVDDSQDNCELLSFILNDAGYEIETVQSVTDGLRVAQSGEFNLYLIDLYFWDGTGFELIERIRAFDQLTPIVVCSGDVRDSVHEEVMRVGVQAFLTKPIDPDQVARTIAEILGDDLQF